jgi:hypothetical protein
MAFFYPPVPFRVHISPPFFDFIPPDPAWLSFVMCFLSFFFGFAANYSGFKNSGTTFAADF